MKKLLYIANVRMPTEKAHGLQIMKTCEALAFKDVQVELVVPKRVNHLKDDVFGFYNVNQNFLIKKISCIDLIFLPFLKKLWFWLETFTFYGSVKGYLKTLRCSSGQDNKADAYYTRDLAIALWLSKKLNVFYEIHTLPENPDDKYKKAWKKCKGLVVISEGLKKELIKNGVEESKIVVARDAVDVNQFKVSESKEESRKRLGLLDNLSYEALAKQGKIVLYTGHLYEWKGADLLAKAAAKLPEAEVCLVGGTKEDIVRFKEKYTSPNLHIVGWKSHKEVPTWLNSADVLVLPNSAKEKISSTFTSPMKLFEYMASKRPIVASNLNSLCEVLNQDNAVLVGADNEELLVSGIKKVLNNNELAQRLAENAFQKVGEFSWQKRAEKIKNFIFR